MFPLRRLLTHYGCLNKEMRLMDKGVYRLTHSVDPSIIIWENTGAPLRHKVKIWLEIYSVAILTFIVTFVGFWGIQLFEKLRNSYAMSDCSGNAVLSMEDAYYDYLLPRDGKMQGMMGCYCRQMYDRYGTSSIKLTFIDGVQYCKDWYVTFFSTDYVNFLQAAWVAVVNYSVQ
jgi:hypothetical protein